MIQFKRGSKASWSSTSTPLADGQPGYDKTRNKIKIGDGSKLWSALPYASGLSAEEILAEESKAKKRVKTDPDDKTLITYGTESPNDKTVGQVYLQYYDTEPEVDYVVSYGKNGIWKYRKWHSGRAECYGTLKIKDKLNSSIEGANLYSDNKSMQKVSYPFKFIETPCEVATLSSPGSFAWLVSRGTNSAEASAVYSIVSTNKYTNNSNYAIALKVEGYWR